MSQPVPSRRVFLHHLGVSALAVTLLGAGGLQVGCNRSAKLVDRLPSGSKVVALGDSLTYGYGVDPDAAYPAVLAELTGWQVINAGVNGDTSADVLHRLDEAIAKTPKLVLLGVGGNDVLRRINPDNTTANIGSVIDNLQAADIEVVLIAQPHFSASALFGKASDNPIYKQLGKDKQVPVLSDVWSQVMSDDSLKSDRIHANTAGYRYFASQLYAYLQQLGYAG